MRIARALAWSYIGQIGSVSILFILSVVISRLLSPAQIGSYAAGAAVTAILTAVTTTGLQAYLVREVELDDQTRASACTVNLIFSGMLAIVVAALGLAGRYFDYDSSVSSVLLILALRPILFALEFQPSALLQRKMNFRVLGIAALTMALINFCTAIACARSGLGALSLGIGVVTGALAQIVVFMILVPRLVIFRLSLADWRKPVLFAIQMTFIGGFSVIVKRACELLVGVYLGLSALGIFTRATTISDGLFFNIYGAFSRVLFASMSEAQNAGEDLRARYLESFDLIMTVFLPIVVSVAILAAPVIHILYGPEWLAAAPILALLMGAQCLALFFSLNWEILIIREQSAAQVRFEASRALGSIMGFAAGLPLGLMGVAAGRFVDAAVGAALYIPKMKRIIPFSTNDVATIYIRTLSCTLLTISPFISLMFYFEWSYDTPIHLILLCGLISTIIWLSFNISYRPLIFSRGR